MNNKKVCTITLSWGDSPTYYHGAPNNALANRTKRFCERHKLPAIAQWEIAENLLRKKCAIECISIDVPDGKGYIDTFYVLDQAKQVMEARGYTHAILIAHEVHLPRVRIVARSLGIAEDDSHPNFNVVIPYDPNSRHIQTTNEFVARVYEACAIIWYWVTGKISLRKL